jgi:galactokinase
LVLAAAVDVDAVCFAALNGRLSVRVVSEGFEGFEVSLSDVMPKIDETGSPAALVRGVFAWFKNAGFDVPGFDAYIESRIAPGSGLSSSAAFEVAVGNIIAALGGIDVTPVDIAKAGRFAENNYMKKPSGLMDQIACSVGGLTLIDFAAPDNPSVRSVGFDLRAFALNLCVIDTKGSHAGLTGEYALIPEEMSAIAEVFGKKYLREVWTEEFFSCLKRVRDAAGDRACLRAAHFFVVNERVEVAADCALRGDIKGFLRNVRLSGLSSVANLQNISVAKTPKRQEIAVALMLSKHILREKGAVRVHGGGFAGSILAFVPDDLLAEYKNCMEGVFGGGSVKVLNVRREGGFVFGG